MGKERPILFSGEMVRAILDGRKTVTRRVVKPQPGLIEHGVVWKGKCYTHSSLRFDSDGMNALCPYGQPGDRLWVRHGWMEYKTPSHMYGAKNARRGAWDQITKCMRWEDGKCQEGFSPISDGGWKNRPSIHMPRWASRITLEVTGVRVERVQAITFDEVEREGVEDVTPDYWVKPWADLWDRINAKRGFSFDKNPFVWVVEFKRLNP